MAFVTDALMLSTVDIFDISVVKHLRPTYIPFQSHSKTMFRACHDLGRTLCICSRCMIKSRSPDYWLWKNEWFRSSVFSQVGSADGEGRARAAQLLRCYGRRRSWMVVSLLSNRRSHIFPVSRTAARPNLLSLKLSPATSICLL